VRPDQLVQTALSRGQQDQQEQLVLQVQTVQMVQALIGEALGVEHPANHTRKMMQFTTKAILT
jgi:hypothetical protein